MKQTFLTCSICGENIRYYDGKFHLNKNHHEGNKQIFCLNEENV